MAATAEVVRVAMVIVLMELVALSTAGVEQAPLTAEVAAPAVVVVVAVAPAVAAPRCTADPAVAHSTMMSPAKHATAHHRTLKTKDIPRVRRMARNL